MTTLPLKILILDENEAGRARLVRTLLRKFPKCVVLECRDATTAAKMAPSECVDVAVVHCAWEMNQENVVRQIRRGAPDVPILVLSSGDRRTERRNLSIRFLEYDQWLLAGNVVEELIRPKPKLVG